MKKITKLRICDWLLLIVTILIFASGIQLEGWWLGFISVWLHIGIGVLFYGLIIWHLQLHYGWKKWINKLRSSRIPVTRLLALFGLLTLISAVIATGHFLSTMVHSPIGGIHGKIGFIMIMFVLAHIIKHHHFFAKKK